MQINDIIKGKIFKIYATHILVKLDEDKTGILHISQVSDYFVYEIEKMFKINNDYWFEIIEIDDKRKRISLSWKSLVPRFLKNPFKFVLEQTPHGFKNLQKFVKGEIND